MILAKSSFFSNSLFFALGINRWKGLWLQAGTNCGLWICFRWWSSSWMQKLLQTVLQYCWINNCSFHLHKAWKNLFSAKVTMWYANMFMCSPYHRFSPCASLWKDTEAMDRLSASKEQGKSDEVTQINAQELCKGALLAAPKQFASQPLSALLSHHSAQAGEPQLHRWEATRSSQPSKRNFPE